MPFIVLLLQVTVVAAVTAIPLLVLVFPPPDVVALLFTLHAPEAPPMVLLLAVTAPVDEMEIPPKVAVPAAALVLLASADREPEVELPILLPLAVAEVDPPINIP
jgi:hypothetical protein